MPRLPRGSRFRDTPMDRAYSSVVEHCVDIAGVGSSILPTPTIVVNSKRRRASGAFFVSGGRFHRTKRGAEGYKLLMKPIARINAISGAIPATDVDSDYRLWAQGNLPDPRESRLFGRMA